MKCPNCGMDIVIATHLCPHCGYAHDFDGAIEPRRDLPEPWDLTPDTTRRRDRHEREARFRAARREGRARRDALRREAGVYVRDERVNQARESRSRDGEKVGRIWVVTRNLVLASLALCALLLLGAAAFYVTGAYFELDGRYTGSYAYWVLPELRYLDTVFGAACAVTALVVVAALAALRRGKRAGSGLRRGADGGLRPRLRAARLQRRLVHTPRAVRRVRAAHHPQKPRLARGGGNISRPDPSQGTACRLQRAAGCAIFM